MEPVMYVGQNGQRLGPLAESKVRQMLAAGQIASTDLGWREGMKGWSTVGEVLQSAPPPPLAPTAVFEQTFPSRHVVTPYKRQGSASALRGVGGWLLFFCIVLTFLSPLITFAGMRVGWESSQESFEMYPAFRTAVIIENCALGAIAIAGPIVGIIIWSGNKKGKTIAQAYLIGRLVLFIGTELVAGAIMVPAAGEAAAVVMGALVGASIRELIFFAIWFLYFQRSRRVYATYGDE